MVLPVSDFHVGDLVVFQKKVMDDAHIVVDVGVIGEVVEILSDALLWTQDVPDEHFPFHVRVISGRFDSCHNYFSNRRIGGKQVRCILSNPLEVILACPDEQPVAPIGDFSDLLGGGF